MQQKVRKFYLVIIKERTILHWNVTLMYNSTFKSYGILILIKHYFIINSPLEYIRIMSGI